jgi:hypothetical protein
VKLLAAATLVLVAAACSSDAAPLSGEDFRRQLTDDLLVEIENAELSQDLDSLATASLAACIEDIAPGSTADLDDFVDCYAERLCTSELVAPVWNGDEATCAEEAKAGFDLGG